MDPTNPYAPPTADLGLKSARSRLTPDDLARARRGRWIWLGLFGLNLIVPVLFASSLLDFTGWLGLIGAVALLVGGGFALLSTYPRWTGVAVAGAVGMALTQFMPILQFLAGALGLGLVGGKFNSETGDPPILGPIPAFVATVATGSALLLASVVSGLFLWSIGLVWRRGGGPIGGDFGSKRRIEPTGDV